ncbi:MAG: hypothetical protein GY898_17835 [Proteobacteria bacterium]|nr:hypothetical protein [Pseudomonadota bacterium]
MRVLLAATAALLLLPCCARTGGGADEPSFTEAVADVYTPCSAETLNFQAASKGVQFAFKPCGSNNFIHATWSPNGLKLYYQASQGGWIRKDTGENYRLRVGVPSARPTWVNSELMAYPDSSGSKIGIYQTSSHILNLLEIPHVNPEQLARGIGADHVLYLAAETRGGVQDIYRLEANTAETEKAFLWMDSGVEDFTYRPESDTVCYRELAGKDVICADGETGKELVVVKDRLRGALSKDNRYLVTEAPGEPVKIFDDDRERPDYLPTTVTPPALWILDLETGKEVLWEGVHGTNFEWYDAATYYGSFMLWGFDGHETNRNVTLVDLRNYLKGQGWDVPQAALAVP